MAVFAYTALDRAGKRTTGTIPAETRAAAMDEVLGRGLSPVTIEEQRAAANGAAVSLFNRVKKTPTRVPAAAVESFTRELANLLAAGLSLSRALHLLRREASNPAARHIWSAIHDDVVGGKSLAEALAKWPKVFSTVYVAMVRAGEQGGFLHVVLQQIADFRTREQDLKGKVKAALVYPCVLAVFGGGVLIFLMTFFIPKFSGIFADFGAQLPYLTQVVVAMSKVATKYGWIVLIVFVIGFIAARKALTSPAGRRLVDLVLLKAPAIGHVTARFALVRFSRMLGTLVGAGVPLVSALRTSRESLGNQTLSDAMSHAIEEVQRGTALSKSLSSTPILFPPSVVEMIAIAEETGRMDKELLRLSFSYEAELDRRLRMLVAVAEPLVLFATAICIGLFVVAMLLPILTLQDVVH